jgi:hypothetical protein
MCFISTECANDAKKAHATLVLIFTHYYLRIQE